MLAMRAMAFIVGLIQHYLDLLKQGADQWLLDIYKVKIITAADFAHGLGIITDEEYKLVVNGSL